MKDRNNVTAQSKVRVDPVAIDDSFWDLPAPSVPFEVLMKAVEQERSEDPDV